MIEKLPFQNEPGMPLRDEFIKLLNNDPDVRQSVLNIVAASTAEQNFERDLEPLAVLPPTVPECLYDPLREQLSAQLALRTTLLADPDLSRLWLVQSENEGLQLARLLATAGQWERLLELWDILAERCKSAARPATAAELQIVEGCLAIHNLIWRDRQAQCCALEVGAEYDYRQHQRSTPRGEVITAQWLPGLVNAGGERQRLPLAATE